MINEEDIEISNFDPGGQRSIMMFGKRFEHLPSGVTVILFNRKPPHLLKPIAMAMIEVGLQMIEEREVNWGKENGE